MGHRNILSNTLSIYSSARGVREVERPARRFLRLPSLRDRRMIQKAELTCGARSPTYYGRYCTRISSFRLNGVPAFT